jgi:chromosome segregation ATPase
VAPAIKAAVDRLRSENSALSAQASGLGSALREVGAACGSEAEAPTEIAAAATATVARLRAEIGALEATRAEQSAALDRLNTALAAVRGFLGSALAAVDDARLS